MVGTASRRSGWLGRHVVPLAIVLGVIVTVTARAQTGPYFEPQSLEPPGFELRVSADYHDASRTDFSRPIFLIAQGSSRLHARELAFTIDLRLSITPSLALQIVLPWLVRDVAAGGVNLVVATDQILPPRSWTLSSWGLGDPTLALGYRFWRARPWSAYAELGATIPIDDNPGAASTPERVPLGTGQHELFVGAGATLDRPVAVSLGYRFGYSPGEHAAFLVRRVSNQSFTSGALGAFAHHRFNAAGELPISKLLSIRLAPSLTFMEVPLLIERTGSRQLQHERVTVELDLAAAIRLHLGDAHRLELRGSLPLIDATDLDPFYPIVIPARGVGIAWFFVGS
jgi:hypothetical protein